VTNFMFQSGNKQNGGAFLSLTPSVVQSNILIGPLANRIDSDCVGSEWISRWLMAFPELKLIIETI